ncbi:hypothetical protein COEREDRAFT_81738 [Coemansia reversa NRRL 1564]|uniref:Uncharacterized protein n=1 Tax=Coemansia reversa (strain ATCC 12441 / NRRL 1564) TaxID=763665 RepID=A0A2G5B9Z7_COERN|nr:hypothetical protein COEREDRAFT_81738 [Coemansia reversa NRRL 1564]|eukprot:PIA15802.1 hypothetical protein COEREDRAFT_81738 [Coemansia reversa NRRL 1564]
MRVGEESNNNTHINSASTGGASERYRLSFDSHESNTRVGDRRRVFARLAPHNSSTTPASHSGAPRPSVRATAPGIGGGADAGDSDGLGDADRYFERQMRQLPLTTAARMVHSDSEADSDADSDAGRPFAEDWRAHQALEQFGQLRRQRFLRDQRQWYIAGISRARATETGVASASDTLLHPRNRARVDSDTAPASHDAQSQLFPSNDVDSYWYNQPTPVELAAHPVTLRRLGHLPPVPRNPAAELSRNAMLEVFRTHRGFAAVRDESDSLEGNRVQQESVAGAQAATDEPEPRRNEKAEAQDAGGADTENITPAPADDAAWTAQGQRQSSARVEGRMLRWLERNTVAQRGLGCALLRPGIRFAGVQKITPLTREHMGTDAFLRMSSPSLEQWDVEVEIQAVDMARGRVSGIMRAINVPRLPKTVVTCWEGEVVDFVNHSPITGKWRASCSEDARHWSLFSAVRAHPETFLHKWPESMRGKRMPQALEDYIFMRWKEISFVNVQPSETGLTIEGFYYICMSRKTGAIEGMLSWMV